MREAGAQTGSRTTTRRDEHAAFDFQVFRYPASAPRGIFACCRRDVRLWRATVIASGSNHTLRGGQTARTGEPAREELRDVMEPCRGHARRAETNTSRIVQRSGADGQELCAGIACLRHRPHLPQVRARKAGTHDYQGQVISTPERRTDNRGRATTSRATSRGNQRDDHVPRTIRPSRGLTAS